MVRLRSGVADETRNLTPVQRRLGTRGKNSFWGPILLGLTLLLGRWAVGNRDRPLFTPAPLSYSLAKIQLQQLRMATKGQGPDPGPCYSNKCSGLVTVSTAQFVAVHHCHSSTTHLDFLSSSVSNSLQSMDLQEHLLAMWNL